MNESKAMREPRTTLEGTVRYEYDNAREAGVARWIDVSRVGAALHLGRYLMPGREVILVFPSPIVADEERRVRAKVVWCRPTKEGGFGYVAGLRIHREDPKRALHFAALGYTARAALNTAASKTVKSAVWPGFTTPQYTDESTTACVANA